MKKNLKEGTKFDGGKPDWSLIPLDAVEEVVKVMTFGAKKYAPDNWKKIENPQRYKSALLRHLTAIQRGEKYDPESSLLHMSHVACNAIFLTWFALCEQRANDKILMHVLEKLKRHEKRQKNSRRK